VASLSKGSLVTEKEAWHVVPGRPSFLRGLRARPGWEGHGPTHVRRPLAPSQKWSVHKKLRGACPKAGPWRTGLTTRFRPVDCRPC
jgi:hypothetical protein